jgi:hypothetical protein
MNTQQSHNYPNSPEDPVLRVISDVAKQLDNLQRTSSELRQAARANEAAIRHLRHFRAKLVVFSLVVSFFAGGAAAAGLLAVYWMPREVVKVIRSLQR